MPVIEAKNLSFRYTEQPVLDGVSFGLEAAQIIAVIGPNGSGKTTLLKMLNGTLFPDQGQMLLEGRETRRWNRGELARTVAMVPQETQA
ncbi:MAG TPA: ABC transporter ATP-binding protein, partial [Smithellaceae bacterium]|nr:ABC transporter ATP-binding protein [Smithellaceae bacterium]